MLDHLTVSRVAAGLGVAWHAANTAVLAEGRRRLLDDPARFDGVAVLCVDEHVRCKGMSAALENWFLSWVWSLCVHVR